MLGLLKTRIRHLFRYPTSTVYIILGLLVAFFALFDGLSIYNHLLSGINEEQQYGYTSTMYISIKKGQGYKINIEDLLTDSKANVKITNFPIWIEGNDGMSNLDVILVSNEKEKYVFQQGRLPSNKEVKNGENVISVGRARMSNLTSDDSGDRFITINGTRYKVVGIMGAKNSNVLDGKLVTYYNCLSSDMKQKILNSKELWLTVESDSEDVYPICKQIKINIVKRNPEIAVDGYEPNDDEQQNEEIETAMAQSGVSVYFLIYFFAIINCVIISEFWIEQRRREIAIRKAFGTSNLRIIGMLFGEMLRISCLAGILCIILQIIFSKIASGIFNIYIEASIANIMTIAVLIIVTSLAVILVPVYKIIKMVPSQAVIS